jgi:SAM-dependent methyltransferase
MANNKSELLDDIARYYANKLAEHGDTPLGVDWNGKESQKVRFEQLCKVIHTKESSFSVNDLGCGYGALLEYLESNFTNHRYLGIDISHQMIHAATRRNLGSSNVRFLNAKEPDQIADFSVASGIFNVRLEKTDAEWLSYMENTLDVLDRTSRLGFAFNCLTSYSDEAKMRDHLYYADPCQLFDLCKRRFSRQVSLLHDYGLYEFTMIVRKEP